MALPVSCDRGVPHAGAGSDGGRSPAFSGRMSANKAQRDGDLGHLKDNVAAMAHKPCADLDQLLLQAGQRPMADRLGCRQRAQEVAEIVGQRVKLEPHGVGVERPA
jgi:hypothetical protein